MLLWSWINIKEALKDEAIRHIIIDYQTIYSAVSKDNQYHMWGYSGCDERFGAKEGEDMPPRIR